MAEVDLLKIVEVVVICNNCVHMCNHVYGGMDIKQPHHVVELLTRRKQHKRDETLERNLEIKSC